MGEKCCLCLPLDCGVKVLGILCIMGTLGMGATCYMNKDREENLKIFVPFLVCSAILSLLFILSFISPSESSKKTVFLGYVVLSLVISTGYYAFMIYNGTMLNWLCSADSIGHMNEAG